MLLITGSASASYITIANGGIVTGSPGDTVGWGFTIHNDSGEWMTIWDVQARNETSPLGPGAPPQTGFENYADINGGPTDFAIPPGQDWTQSFSVAAFTGLGAYAIDPGILFGAEDQGTFYITYQLYDGDPTVSTTNSVGGLTQLLTDTGAAPTFEIDVQNAPEPSATVLVGAGCLLILLRSFRRRRSNWG
jgi:hypothetical protein